MLCPVCGSERFTLSTSNEAIGREIRIRERFVSSRLRRKGSPAELKDLTDFMHGFEAPLEACAVCGLLIRSEQKVRNAESYSEDPNDPGIMKQLLPRYVQAFRNKAPGFRSLLKPGSEVLELGSHLGAFLQVAAEWNWNAVGLDVGDDTAAFARSQGLTVRQTMIEDASIPNQTYDAVFIWNCFEQLTNPAPTLIAIRRALRQFGLLVIRVPNARFYRSMRPDRSALAWNNLLGFPYLYGYTAELISRLVRRFGFEYVNGFDSELVTLPFPDLTSGIHTEQRAVSRRVGRWSIETTAATGVLTGPWIEMIYRKVEEPPVLTQAPPDLRFLRRAA